MLPSIKLSSTPVTVTVCGVLQLAVVKVRLPVDSVPSLLSEELRAIVTLAVGALSSTTLKLAVPPASVVVRPLVGVTVMPAAVFIDTAAISHCIDPLKLLLITTLVAPASRLEPPPIVVLVCDQFAVCPAPRVALVAGLFLQYKTSMTCSPAALDAVTEAVVPVPVALTKVPNAVPMVWATPLKVLAPPAAAVDPENDATTLAVPTVGLISAQSSTAWLPVPRPIWVSATPP